MNLNLYFPTTPTYTFIFVIISSSNIPQYMQMKELSRLYYNLFNTKIKHFYIEHSNNLPCQLIEINDTIYIKGDECFIPGILLKTKSAIEYINSKYKYNYLIRTNLSSFWNLHHLLQLSNYLPKTNLCCGYRPFNSFISGTSIILSNDVARHIAPLIDKIPHISIDNYNDDVYISILLKYYKYNLTNIELYGSTLQMLIYDSDNIPDTTSPNILFYRINNKNRQLDIDIIKKLLLTIYNITT